MDIGAWVRAGIQQYRSWLADAAPELAEEAKRHLDLTPVCKIFVFTAERPVWQAIVAVQSPLVTDEELVVHQVETWNAREAFDEVLNEPIWNTPLPPTPEGLVPEPEPDATLRTAGEKIFLQLLHTVQFWNNQKPRPPDRYLQHGWSRPGCLVWEHVGSLDGMEPGLLSETARDVASHNVENRKRRAEQPPASNEERLASSFEPRYEVHGAYLIPRIRVGVPRDRSLGALQSLSQIRPGLTVMKTTLQGYPLRVTHSGFLGIYTSDPAVALRLLNRVALAMLEQGFPAFVFREQDLASLHPPQGDDDYGWGGAYSAVPRQYTQVDDWSFTSHWLRVAEFLPVLSKAEEIGQSPYANYVYDFLEAHTHLEGKEPNQSLLFSWTVLERWVHDQWTQAQGKADGPPFGEKLYWLAGSGRISSNLLQEIRRVKKVRNNVMHGKQAATQEEASHALATVELAIAGHALRTRRKPTPFEESLPWGL